MWTYDFKNVGEKYICFLITKYYNLLTEKKDEKIHDFELKKFSSNTIFRWYTFGKFYFAKSNYFSGRQKKVK